MAGDGQQEGPYSTYSDAQSDAVAEEMSEAGLPGYTPGGAVTAVLRGSVEAQDRWNQESARLSEGASYREAPNASNKDYLGFDHQQLKTWSDEADGGSVGESAGAWTGLANAMAGLTEDLNAAGKQESNEWSGDAAARAASFNGGTSGWADSTGQQAQLASHRMTAQSEAASRAKNDMPEPIPFSWGEEFAKWQGAGLADLDGAVAASIQRHEQSQAAHQEASRVMSTRDSGLHGAAAEQPSFAPPPTFASASSGGGDGSVGGSISGGSATGPSLSGGSG
ncbi:MAG: hypothetical protein ACRDQF_21460, partial [Thermocrispum sp.]